MNAKPDYGIDAPGVVRNLAICGVAVLIVSAIFPVINIGEAKITGLYWSGIWLLISPALMLLYSKVGKFRHADRMVRMAALQGGETILDVGTGRGLLLVAAAKKLTTGRAIGIDIWKASDLSGNLIANTEENLAMESVAFPGLKDRCQLLSEPAQQMTFADGTFDAIFSNMCLHNIDSEAERTRACQEIARVLKPGGIAVISDFKNTKSYARAFQQAGLAASRKIYPFDTFPPVGVVTARKPW